MDEGLNHLREPARDMWRNRELTYEFYFKARGSDRDWHRFHSGFDAVTPPSYLGMGYLEENYMVDIRVHVSDAWGEFEVFTTDVMVRNTNKAYVSPVSYSLGQAKFIIRSMDYNDAKYPTKV